MSLTRSESFRIFFAPSAVRPSSPVTVEQKHDPSPLMAKTPITPGDLILDLHEQSHETQMYWRSGSGEWR